MSGPEPKVRVPPRYLSRAQAVDALGRIRGAGKASIDDLGGRLTQAEALIGLLMDLVFGVVTELEPDLAEEERAATRAVPEAQDRCDVINAARALVQQTEYRPTDDGHVVVDRMAYVVLAQAVGALNRPEAGR